MGRGKGTPHSVVEDGRTLTKIGLCGRPGGRPCPRLSAVASHLTNDLDGLQTWVCAYRVGSDLFAFRDESAVLLGIHHTKAACFSMNHVLELGDIMDPRLVLSGGF